MKANKRNIIIFILIIGLMTFLIQVVYIIMTGDQDLGALFEWFSNFPLILILGFIVLVIIHKINSIPKFKNDLYGRVIFELLVLTVVSAVYTISTKYIASIIVCDFKTTIYDYVKSITVILLGTYYLALMLELFLYNQRQTNNEKHIAVIEREKAEYLYTSLKNQMNPHFLFNSLNVLSSLAFENPEKANRYTKKLSNIYRYVLSTSSLQSVSVKQELTFLESYIYLVTIRFENTLFININGHKETEKAVIPVSVQTLVDNAIKHNIASLKQPLTIDVNITLEYIEVVNNLQLRLHSEKTGLGLNNLQKQYDLYNKKIEIKKTENQFVVRLPYL